MKKVIFIIVLLLTLSNVVSAQKAPDGFCGMRWGDKKEEVKKTLDLQPHVYIYEFEDFISFMPDSEKSAWGKIGEVEVTQYRFNFSKSGKFYKASVDLPRYSSERPNNFDTLLRSLMSKYGKPTSITPLVLKINPNVKVGMQYYWDIKNTVEITLWYDDMEKKGINGTLVYTYLPTEREMKQLREKDVEKTKGKL